MAITNLKRSQSEILREIDKISYEMFRYIGKWRSHELILGMLFYRFISESQNSFVNKKENKAGNASFDFAALSDKKAEQYRESITEEKGFYIRPSELFENVRKLTAGKRKLHETLISIFNNIGNTVQDSKYERDLAGMFDILDGKRNLPDDILMNLFCLVGDLPTGKKSNSLKRYRKTFDSIMREFAFDLGYQGHMYYTPLEVSELLVRITTVGKKSVDKVYDPTCGSGSLLLKFVEVLGEDNILNGIFGQDCNDKSYNFCRINMILHDINFNKFDIALGDTLSKPDYRKKQPFEAIASNPPFSVSWEGNTNRKLAKDIRFSPAGVLAPTNKADMAFVMHSLAWLAPNGTAATLAYPGAMYRMGIEMKIRKYLVENNFVDAVIELPTYLFFGSSSAKCILVMKRNKVDNKVLFIDASYDFSEEGRLNKLNQDHMQKILDCYAKREEYDHYSRLVGPQEIAQNEHKLSVNTYIEPEIHEEIVDISDFNIEVEDIIAVQSNLRTQLKWSAAIFDGGF